MKLGDILLNFKKNIVSSHATNHPHFSLSLLYSNLSHILKRSIQGVFIGAGAILPGISSGVLCVIFGIYDKLVDSVLGIFHNFKKNFFYLLPIALGTFIGVLVFGNALNLLFKNFPMPTNYAFIGLILGSIPLLLKRINSERGFRLHYIIYTIISFLIGLLAVILENYISSNILTINSVSANNLSTNISLFSPAFLFLIFGGFFMAIGIVVPGVSSTLILMCFGIYNIYLNAISTLNLSILIPLGIGVILGGILFLKIIQYLLEHFYMQTFYSIIGFTLGSILVLYMPLTFDFTGIISILLLIICFYIAGLFEKKSN